MSLLIFVIVCTNLILMMNWLKLFSPYIIMLVLKIA